MQRTGRFSRSADFAPTQPLARPSLHQARPRRQAGADQCPQPADLQGVVTFNYTLIPLTEAARATPPIPFSYFDPKAGAYVDLTIPSVPVTVKPGAVPGDLASLLQAGSAEAEPEKELVLSGLAASRGRTAASLVPPQQQPWFPLVQLRRPSPSSGSGAGTAAAVIWKRIRTSSSVDAPAAPCAANGASCNGPPGRRMRPALPTAAVNAMRVACAPHYPAEPRALVGSDVLPLLPESERSGRAGEVVRRFFAVTDAARFGTAASAVADLLPLKPDLERVLQELEQKL